MILNNHYDLPAIEAWDKRFRANFFHAATGVKPAILIGSTDENGIDNLAIFSSVFHLGSKPPIFGFMVRPTEVKRDTLDNILSKGFYSMNLFQSPLIHSAHQTSAKYETEIDEFEKTGIEKQIWEDVPIVKGAPLSMKLRFLELIPIKHNNTKIVLGEVIAIYANNLIVEDDGLVLHENNDIVGVTGLDTYYKSLKLKRMDYARPNKAPKEK